MISLEKNVTRIYRTTSQRRRQNGKVLVYIIPVLVPVSPFPALDPAPNPVDRDDRMSTLMADRVERVYFPIIVKWGIDRIWAGGALSWHKFHMW